MEPMGPNLNGTLDDATMVWDCGQTETALAVLCTRLACTARAPQLQQECLDSHGASVAAAQQLAVYARRHGWSSAW